MNKKIRAVIFDCYGTLFDESKIFENTFDFIFARTGIDKAIVKKKFELCQQVVNRRLKHRFFLSQRERYSLIFDILLSVLEVSSLSEQDATDVLMRQFEEAEIYPDVQSILKHVGRKYKIGLLTNGDNECITELLNRYHLEFDAIITSETVKAYKPNPIIFQTMLSILKVERTQVLMVGNDLEDDIVGAENQGLSAIWLNRQGAFPKELKMEQLPDTIIADLSDLVFYV